MNTFAIGELVPAALFRIVGFKGSGLGFIDVPLVDALEYLAFTNLLVSPVDVLLHDVVRDGQRLRFGEQLEAGGVAGGACFLVVDFDPGLALGGDDGLAIVILAAGVLADLERGNNAAAG